MVGDANPLPPSLLPAADDDSITAKELGSRYSGHIRTARAVYTLHKCSATIVCIIVDCYVVNSVME